MTPRERSALLAVLGLVGGLVTATAVPAAFTIDESNYLASLVALREGRVTMPGTEGLPPTTELLWFDPVDRWRQVEATPVAPLAPPLYAVLALPFSWFGWRGLVALNTLAFLTTAALVFAWVRRMSRGSGPAWVALGAFALGSPQLEYAQGVWPHELAMLLVFGAAYLAFLVREGRGVWLAAMAGMLAGLAGGVRHQDLFVAGCVGVALVVLVPARRRVSVAVAFGAGFALPVLGSCTVNWLRAGHFHPAWKGTVAYLSLGASPVAATKNWLEALHVFWAKVIDFAAHPVLPGELGKWHGYLHKEEQTGAFLVIGGAVKKAWLQSSPWIALSLFALAAAWWRRGQARAAVDATTRELRAAGLVVAPVLALFAFAGFGRFDGLCYNQRYFQELLPFVAVALGSIVDRMPVRPALLGAGGAIGLGLAALAFLLWADNLAGVDLAMKVPLGLAASLVLLWPLRDRLSISRASTVALGAAIAWGLGAHLLDDVRATNRIRERHLGQIRELAEILPDRAALVVWLNHKVGLGPLILDRDLVMVDPSADDASATPAVVHGLLAQRRPVYLVADRYPGVLLDRLRQEFSFRELEAKGTRTLEVFELSQASPMATDSAP